MENILYCYGSALVPRKLVRRKLKNLGKICTTTTYTDGKGKRRFKGHKKTLRLPRSTPRLLGWKPLGFISYGVSMGIIIICNYTLSLCN